MQKTLNHQGFSEFGIRAIIFGMGDTLVDVTQIRRAACRRAARTLALQKLIKNEKTFLAAYAKADGSIEAPNLNHLFSDLRIIRRTLNLLDVSPSPAIIGTYLNAHRREVRRRLGLVRGLRPLFMFLRRQKLRIGVLSDGTTDEQLEQLETFRVLDLVDSLIVSEDLNVEKHDSAMFLQSIRELHVDAGNVVMVGDSPSRDIAGAKKNGIRTSLLDKTGTAKMPRGLKPDFIISSLSEIKRLSSR
jgi:FMN phosphatase YigB (HAD superfamily)